MTDKKRTIAILTGGGDVPGLNPAIRAITIRALREGYRVVGIRRGWAGLVDYNARRRTPTTRDNVQELSEADRESRRPHRRHVPPHVAHAAEPSADASACRRI